MKNLPPIFKVSTSGVKNTNQEYYYNSISNDSEVKKETLKNDELDINDKLDRIFNTRGYSFNIPVSISFAGKKIDTYLALRRNDTIITLDNEVIPISTITNLEIKSPSD